tara:strand:- start:824 stop:2317 length:1494 start_codon:yes stop_codon:yes gene_type:complete
MHQSRNISHVIDDNKHDGELLSCITKWFGITITYHSFASWPKAVGFLTELWNTNYMTHKNVGVVVRVELGTCYAGTGMLLFNPNASDENFHAILLDKGFGFDKTTPAVTEQGYTTSGMHENGQKFTDRVNEILNWRIISKQYQENRAHSPDSRWGRLVTALANLQYQHPIGTFMGDADVTMKVNGARFTAQAQCVMCTTISEKEGGHTDCVLVAGHRDDHQIRTGSRRSTEFMFLPRNGTKGLCCQSSYLSMQHGGSKREESAAVSAILSLPNALSGPAPRRESTATPSPLPAPARAVLEPAMLTLSHACAMAIAPAPVARATGGKGGGGKGDDGKGDGGAPDWSGPAPGALRPGGGAWCEKGDFLIGLPVGSFFGDRPPYPLMNCRPPKAPGSYYNGVVTLQSPAGESSEQSYIVRYSDGDHRRLSREQVLIGMCLSGDQGRSFMEKRQCEIATRAGKRQRLDDALTKRDEARKAYDELLLLEGEEGEEDEAHWAN